MMSGENKVSWNVKDLIPNGEYYFRVQAVNKIGGGEFIELRNPVIAEDQKRKSAFQAGGAEDGGSERCRESEQVVQLLRWMKFEPPKSDAKPSNQ